ncbi:MAG: TMEM165/GDT1 family protein [Betaproteobacteria bacterium]|nr:TMEM165/GDT1 family protein [Betaproteobacteria bacterium]
MDIKLLALVFGSVFLAELGDKTQLATFLFASNKDASPLVVFLGASLALIAASALAVLAGGLVSRFVDPKLLSYGAGALFIAVGVWTILRA